MNKQFLTKLILCTALLPVTAQAAPAAKEGAFYLKAGLGMGARENADDELAEARFDDGATYSLAVGVHGSGKFKNTMFELEYGFNHNRLDTLWLHPTPAINRVEKAVGSIDYETVQFVGYYNFKNDSRFTPYVGLGVGWGRSKLEGLGSYTLLNFVPGYPLTTTTKWALAVSPRAGVNYAINDRLDVALDVRQTRAPEGVYVNAVGELTRPSVNITSAEVALRYSF
jgi:opacity protein-like surface antigen